MIIKTEDLKNISQTILTAVDSNELSVLTETLELVVKDKTLYMNVTNREYYASVKLKVDYEEEFHATVNANLFLKLVSQFTTETVEFTIADNFLEIKGNGKYKLPLIYDDDQLLELPTISIDNVTSEFDVSSDILISIAQYNSKQLNVGNITKPVQKMYYVDEKGAITFTNGACINNFTLDKPIKILLTSRLVKLFKLFKGKSVHFTLGQDPISDEIIQTKVRFNSDDVDITAILNCDDAIISSVPVSAIRQRANNDYPYSVNLSKDALTQALGRLLLFTNESKAFCTFKFTADCVEISDISGENVEKVPYNNATTNIADTYSAILDLNDIKITLDNFNESYINFKFGDGAAFAIYRGKIVNIVPECTL